MRLVQLTPNVETMLRSRNLRTLMTSREVLQMTNFFQKNNVKHRLICSCINQSVNETFSTVKVRSLCCICCSNMLKIRKQLRPFFALCSNFSISTRTTTAFYQNAFCEGHLYFLFGSRRFALLCRTPCNSRSQATLRLRLHRQRHRSNLVSLVIFSALRVSVTRDTTIVLTLVVRLLCSNCKTVKSQLTPIDDFYIDFHCLGTSQCQC